MSMVNVQLDPDGPITQMDDALLVCRTGGHSNDNETVKWIEYRLLTDPEAERAVHRSVHVTLKKPMVWGFGKAGSIGG